MKTPLEDTEESPLIFWKTESNMIQNVIQSVIHEFNLLKDTPCGSLAAVGKPVCFLSCF